MLGVEGLDLRPLAATGVPTAMSAIWCIPSSELNVEEGRNEKQLSEDWSFERIEDRKAGVWNC
jgi:hypothetical protein